MSVTTFGKYELVSKLASGGMAVTYKAFMHAAAGMKKPVVLKLIHPHLAEENEFVEMFVEEAKLSATLTHSNIAQVFDFGEIDGRYFIAMELVDGQSLSHVLKRAKRKGYPVMSVPLAMLITVEMCEALYYAHTRSDENGQPLNLVHRDVSPENVLISWQGEVKLVDFGIAKSTMTGKQTATGMVKGKYPYFSPEQSRADRTMDARTDVYAATVVLYEMLCARRPYEGEFVEVMRALLTGDYPLPSSLNPEVPPELEQLMLKGLALDRNARFRTAREMAQALNALTHQLYPEVHRSDLQSLMSVLFEEDLKAAGRPAEVRAGFRQLLDGKPRLATDETAAPDDKTPPGGSPKLATGKRKAVTGRNAAVEQAPTTMKPAGERKRVTNTKMAQLTQGSTPTQVPDTRFDPGNPADTGADENEDDSTRPLPEGVKMTGPQQQTQLSLDSPEKAEARAKAVKMIAAGAGVLFVLIAGLAIMFGGKKESGAGMGPKTPVWATSVPPGAEVVIDGKVVGKAPMDGMLAEGTYTFAMSLEGYRPWTKRVTITGNRQVHVDAKLVPNDKDEPVDDQIPTLPQRVDGPVTQEAVDAGIVYDADVKHVYTWPMRSFTIWPQHHTLPLSQYKVFELDLEPETPYQLTLSGSIDLGPKLGRTSQIMYYLAGEKVDPKERFGYLSPSTKVIRGAEKLYAWVFDDDPSDNKGKISINIRISKYIPERFATFVADEHTLTPASTDVLRVEGLQADHQYVMVMRADGPRVMGQIPQGVLCIHDTPKQKPINKKYVWYPLKHTGKIDLTGATGMTCMFLAWDSVGTSGLLEVDIDDLAELGQKKKK
ncbi:MAG: serine/threonine protein kinase [Myxococcaceae bacterium]|nr:serine/threonine protein kinase [Myxococcaceae bacterium]